MGNYRKYDEDFKQSLVNLYHSGKTQTALCKECVVYSSALAKWIRLYSKVRVDEEPILTAKQIRELQKKNALLEEGNLILKKRLPSSLHTQPKTECSSSPENPT